MNEWTKETNEQAERQMVYSNIDDISDELKEAHTEIPKKKLGLMTKANNDNNNKK